MPSVEWDSEDYLIWRNPCLEVGVQGSVAVAVSSCVGQGRLVMRSLVQVVGHYLDVIHGNLSGIFGLATRGINLGIDFKPGAIEEVSIKGAAGIEDVRAAFVENCRYRK